MLDRDFRVRSSARAVRFAAVLNWGFGLAIMAGLIASFLFGEAFTRALMGTDGTFDIAARTGGMRWLMLLGVILVIAIHVLLQALGRMIATVSTGDPFIASNATRLRTIGWSLLAIQLLDIPAALIARGYPALGSAAPDVGISPAGWLAVLMTFVLARIFVVGTAMRDDLEGTI